MAIEITEAVATGTADAILALANAGAGAATIQVATTAFASILATFTCDDPAYDAAVAGVAALAGTPLQDTADASGIAAVWRLRDSDTNEVMNGPVATSGGGDLNLSTAARTAACEYVRSLLAGACDVQFTTSGDTTFASPLATVALNSGGFEAAAAGEMDLDITPAVTGTGSGSGAAALFRFRTSGGTEVFRGTVGTSGEDWNFPAGVVIGPGATLTLTAFTFSMPATIAASDGALVIANTTIVSGEVVEITSGEFEQPLAA